MRITSDTPISELYQPSEELAHAAIVKKPQENHKYISREWKDGKWNYTYPDDGKGAQQGTTVTDTTGGNRSISSSVNNRAGSSTVSTKGKLGQKTDAVASAVKKAADNAKNIIKDALGYDEKEAKTKAETNASIKRAQANMYQNRADTAKNSNIGDKKMVDLLNEIANNKQAEARAASEAAKQAAKAFANTPLGHLEYIKDTIGSIKSWANALFNDIKNQADTDRDEDTVDATTGTSPRAKAAPEKEEEKHKEDEPKEELEKAEDLNVSGNGSGSGKGSGSDKTNESESETAKENSSTALDTKLTAAKEEVAKAEEEWKSVQQEYEIATKKAYDLYQQVRKQKELIDSMPDGPAKEAALKAYNDMYEKWQSAYSESMRLQSKHERHYKAYMKLKDAVADVEKRMTSNEPVEWKSVNNVPVTSHEVSLDEALKAYKKELEEELKDK